MKDDRQVIVLAAGKGTRMGTDKPKVLYPLNGKRMILYVVETLRRLSSFARRPIMVVGFGADQVRRAVGNVCDYVLQDKQLGTGHAVACARDLLVDYTGDVLVLYGDHPLVEAQTIEKLFQHHQSADNLFTMMTTRVADFEEWRAGFYHYGRILRDQNGKITAIREKVECSEAELEITEVNPAYFCFQAQWLWENIDTLQANNNQQEFYLTDLVEIAFAQGIAIDSMTIDPLQCLGVNTPEQLKLAEKLITQKKHESYS